MTSYSEQLNNKSERETGAKQKPFILFFEKSVEIVLKWHVMAATIRDSILKLLTVTLYINYLTSISLVTKL